MEINQGILTAIIGLIAGIVGSLVAPWIKWGIEKRRLRYNNRLELIKELKVILDNEEFDRKKFVNRSDYHLIRDHLSSKSIDFLESTKFVVRYKAPNDPFSPGIKFILFDLANLERKWGIK
jgi:hypothetical protein